MPSTGFLSTAFTVVPIVIGVVFVAIVVFAIINVRKARKAGHNPLTMQTDLASRALDSELLRPDRPLSDRLSELDGLRENGTISADEHAEARRRVLGS